jgi:hypothetical protein
MGPITQSTSRTEQEASAMDPDLPCPGPKRHLGGLEVQGSGKGTEVQRHLEYFSGCTKHLLLGSLLTLVIPRERQDKDLVQVVYLRGMAGKKVVYLRGTAGNRTEREERTRSLYLGSQA